MEIDDIIKEKPRNIKLLDYFEKQGIIINRLLIEELIKRGINFPEQKRTTTTLAVSKEELKPENIAASVRYAIFSQLSDREASLIAFSRNIKDYKKRMNYGEDYFAHEIQFPKYIIKIIRGSGLIDCHTNKEILEFEFNEEERELLRELSR